MPTGIRIRCAEMLVMSWQQDKKFCEELTPAFLTLFNNSVIIYWIKLVQRKINSLLRHDTTQSGSLVVPTSPHLKASSNKNPPWRYSSDELWPAEQPPLAVFPYCTRRYWVDVWSAHRIPQLHFQLSKPDRYFFIQVTTQFIRTRGCVDPVPDPTPSEKS
jgi:hypothetical protein